MNDSTISAVFSPAFQTKIREIDILLARSCSHCRREGDLLSCVMQISKRERGRGREKREKNFPLNVAIRLARPSWPRKHVRH